MTDPFVEISDSDSLERFMTPSQTSPVVIFKHSQTCGISARAFSEMSRLTRPVGLITVQTARAVSGEIEGRFNVAHESPQVLILQDGQVVWTASHGEITAAAVEAALLRASKNSGQ